MFSPDYVAFLPFYMSEQPETKLVCWKPTPEQWARMMEQEKREMERRKTRQFIVELLEERP
jgi:hypothetical protein